MSTTITTVTTGGGGGESIFSPLTLVTPNPSPQALKDIPALEVCPTGDIIISLTPEAAAPAKPPTDPKAAPAPASDASTTAKPTPLRFRVSSSVLCAASPVFNAMLGPNSSFAEAVSLRTAARAPASSPLESSAPLVQHVQPLYDDNGTALAVILYAIHLQTHKVPREVTFQQLKQLAVVCDKYDCVGAVRLWAEVWMEPFRKNVTMVGFEDWLFIAWVFSSRNFFAKVSKSLVSRIVVGEDEAGKRVVSWAAHKGRGRDRLRQFDAYVPEVILNALLKQRNTIVKEIVTLCSSTFTKYASGVIPLCKHTPNDPRCDTYLLGALYKAFAGIGMLGFDMKTVDSYSIEELVDAVRGIRIKHLDYEGWGEIAVEEEENGGVNGPNVVLDDEPPPPPPPPPPVVDAGADVVADAGAGANAEVNAEANAEANADANVNADPVADANAEVNADVAADANAEPDNVNAVVAADAAVNDNAEPNANANAVAVDVNSNAEPNTDPNANADFVVVDQGVVDGTVTADVVVDANPNTEANGDAAVPVANVEPNIADANADVNTEANDDTNANNAANADAVVAGNTANDENADANADVNVNTDANNADAAATQEDAEEAEVPVPPAAPVPDTETPEPPPAEEPKPRMGHIRHEHNSTCNPMKQLVERVQEEAVKVEELNLTQFRGWKRKKLEKDGGSWAKLTEELQIAMVGA
ncbi:hypothetical protein DFP73DRAFT_557864 [Morchella snyderi]|nr:hypothetical protein DFP73DRAFT_557864 [Morchella snyderi]